MGALEQVDAVFGQPFLQQIQAVGRADHQPVGGLQGQLHVVGEFNVAGKSAAVVGQCRLDLRQNRGRVAIELTLQCLPGLQNRLGLFGQTRGVLTIATQRERLLALTHAQHLLTQRAHALLQLSASTDFTQRQQTGNSHQSGQNQYQSKTQHQLAGRAQTGQPLAQ